MSTIRTADGTHSFHEITPGGTVLDVVNATVTYKARSLGLQRNIAATAVDQVSVEVKSGRSLGVVGESGCGKSSLARSIFRLAPLTGGEISIGERPGTDATRVRTAKRIARSVQMVFQDPFSSLNPRMTIMDFVGEPLLVHGHQNRSDRRDRVIALLERVGLSRAHAAHYPHQLSGGQRQRVGIARSLAVEPSLLVCDEPTSALDVSIQAQVVEVFQHLQREANLTYFFITHDLALLPQLTEVVAVMYLGRIVEAGPVMEVLHDPRHPYTNSLVASLPTLGRTRSRTRRTVIRGDAAANESETGCILRKRCWLHTQLDSSEAQRCVEESPEQVTVTGSPDTPRAAACHYASYVPAARSSDPETTTPVSAPHRRRAK